MYSLVKMVSIKALTTPEHITNEADSIKVTEVGNRDVPYAFGSALLFGASIPLSKYLLGEVNPMGDGSVSYLDKCFLCPCG